MRTATNRIALVRSGLQWTLSRATAFRAGRALRSAGRAGVTIRRCHVPELAEPGSGGR